MFEKVGDFFIFGLSYVKVVHDFFVLISLVCPWLIFCVVFAGLVYVVGFVGSYCFLQLVVSMSILFVSSEVLIPCVNLSMTDTLSHASLNQPINNPTSTRTDTNSTPIQVQPTDITRYVQNTSIYKNYCIY